MKVSKTLVFLFAWMLILASICQAQTNPITRPFEKLARGVGQILYSPVEIPGQMLCLAIKEQKKHDSYFAALGGYIAGVVPGVGYAVWRAVAGVFTVVTFPVPTPTYDHSFFEPETFSSCPENAGVVSSPGTPNMISK